MWFATTGGAGGAGGLGGLGAIAGASGAGAVVTVLLTIGVGVGATVVRVDVGVFTGSVLSGGATTGKGMGNKMVAVISATGGFSTLEWGCKSQITPRLCKTTTRAIKPHCRELNKPRKADSFLFLQPKSC